MILISLILIWLADVIMINSVQFKRLSLNLFSSVSWAWPGITRIFFPTLNDIMNKMSIDINVIARIKYDDLIWFYESIKPADEATQSIWLGSLRSKKVHPDVFISWLHSLESVNVVSLKQSSVSLSNSCLRLIVFLI